jgi:hypothetical protein
MKKKVINWLLEVYRSLPLGIKVKIKKIIHKGNVNASKHFIKSVEECIIKNQNTPISVVEIGVDRGASTYPVSKLLRKGDRYDLFDVNNCPLAKELDKIKSSSLCDIYFWGNSTKEHDSYAWSLAKMYINLSSIKQGVDLPLWDVVYLDGAHTFNIDATSTAIIKKMVKVGGLIIFDDMDWTMEGSPTCNNSSNWKKYTNEQMKTSHVALIVNVLMRDDADFEEVKEMDDSRSVFRKI